MRSFLQVHKTHRPCQSRYLQQGLCRFSITRLNRNELVTPRIDYEAKYAEKLREKAKQQGVSVAELRQRLKEAEAAKRKEQVVNAGPSTIKPPLQSSTPSSKSNTSRHTTASIPTRKDGSPVKPLGSILNLDKILQTPHTPDQISVLWRAYHQSRSKGTGRGYLCATVPVDAYEKMVSVAKRYPYFVMPVPKEDAQVADPQSEGNQNAYEFHFMEWGFHGTPSEPRTAAELFAKPNESTNPQTSTIMFTPLQEYKMRNSFATPYLVLTNYTELASSHGIVLLRGEITPSSGDVGVGADGRYMLNQQDAQLLALGVQKFYLWSEDQEEREALLRAFHEKPSEFQWKELLKHSDLAA